MLSQSEVARLSQVQSELEAGINPYAVETIKKSKKRKKVVKVDTGWKAPVLDINDRITVVTKDFRTSVDQVFCPFCHESVTLSQSVYVKFITQIIERKITKSKVVGSVSGRLQKPTSLPNLYLTSGGTGTELQNKTAKYPMYNKGYAHIDCYDTRKQDTVSIEYMDKPPVVYNVVEVLAWPSSNIKVDPRSRTEKYDRIVVEQSEVIAETSFIRVGGELVEYSDPADKLLERRAKQDHDDHIPVDVQSFVAFTKPEDHTGKEIRRSKLHKTRLRAEPQGKSGKVRRIPTTELGKYTIPSEAHKAIKVPDKF
jgi:hypothetical protein